MALLRATFDVLKNVFFVCTSIRITIIALTFVYTTQIKRMNLYRLFRSWNERKNHYLQNRASYNTLTHLLLDAVFMVSDIDVRIMNNGPGCYVSYAWVSELVYSDYSRIVHEMAATGQCFGCYQCHTKRRRNPPAETLTAYESIITDSLRQNEEWVLDAAFERITDPQDVTTAVQRLCSNTQSTTLAVKELVACKDKRSTFFLFVQYQRFSRVGKVTAHNVIYTVPYTHTLTFPPEPPRMQSRNSLQTIRTLSASLGHAYDISSHIRLLEGPCCDFRCGRPYIALNCISLRFSILCLVQMDELYSTDDTRGERAGDTDGFDIHNVCSPIYIHGTKNTIIAT